MTAQTAQIIDLEEHRKARRGDLRRDPAFEERQFMPAMVMVPVWFVPTFIVPMRPGPG